jgi:hypothetical protein
MSSGGVTAQGRVFLCVASLRLYRLSHYDTQVNGKRLRWRRYLDGKPPPADVRKQEAARLNGSA